MKKKGFTLIELMVVILIVGILAAASIPLMRGRIDSAKWSEANAMAGTIKSAERVYYVENGSVLTGTVSTNATALGFDTDDLTGTYFDAGDFSVAGTDGTDIVITVTSDGSGKMPAAGSYQLEADGDWVKQ